VDGTGSVSCPMGEGGFGISDVKISGSATRELVFINIFNNI
jgi:hypothetical protein